MFSQSTLFLDEKFTHGDGVYLKDEKPNRNIFYLSHRNAKPTMTQPGQVG